MLDFNAEDLSDPLTIAKALFVLFSVYYLLVKPRQLEKTTTKTA